MFISKGNGLTQTADDGFIIAGGIGSPTFSPYLLKVDKQGAMQWEQRYPSLANAELFTVLPAFRRRLLGKWSAARAGPPSAAPADERGYPRKNTMDANYSMIDENRNAPPNALFQTGDHGFIVTGQGYAIKVDQTGKLD